MLFSKMISSKRVASFATSKEFHREANLSCSYYHYSKIEAGTIPDINLAVEIIRALNIPIKQGLYTYLNSSLVDKEARSLFSDLQSENAPELAGTVTINKSLILNHAQVSFLTKDPMYLEATLLLAINAKYKSFSVAEVSKTMKLPVEQTKTMLHSLTNLGLLTKTPNNQYTTKEWIYTPNDPEFLPLKDATIKRALEKYLGQSPEDKWQRTITRPTTPEQRDYINQMLENLCSTFVALPEPRPEESKPYTMGVFSSWRTFGNA